MHELTEGHLHSCEDVWLKGLCSYSRAQQACPYTCNMERCGGGRAAVAALRAHRARMLKGSGGCGGKNQDPCSPPPYPAYTPFPPPPPLSNGFIHTCEPGICELNFTFPDWGDLYERCRGDDNAFAGFGVGKLCVLRVAAAPLMGTDMASGGP